MTKAERDIVERAMEHLVNCDSQAAWVVLKQLLLNDGRFASIRKQTGEANDEG